MTHYSPKWWSEDTVALVTGASKGIGYEFVRAFAAEGLSVVLTARDPVKGRAAVADLKATGLKNIYFHELEVNNPESVTTSATWLKEKFGGFDILVNNAGVVSGPAAGSGGLKVTEENAKAIMDTNYFGLKNVTEGLLPVLRASPAGARIVNLTSRAGLYERLKGSALKRSFRDEDSYSTELADSLVEKYLKDVKAGNFVEEGWIGEEPGRMAMYSESKMFVNMYAIALGKSLLKSQPEDHQIFVTNTCPGTTQTQLFSRGVEGGFDAPPGFQLKTPAEGADTGMWLALLPKEELADKVGKFYGERTEYLFGRKNPRFA